MFRKLLNNCVKIQNNFITSLRIQTQLFFKHSTLHGVRYIAERDRSFVERFMWFVCVSIGAVATGVVIVNLWEKFQTNPTITGLDTNFHSWKVPFPAITVCLEKPYSLDKIENYYEQNANLVSKDLLIDIAKLSFDSLISMKKKIYEVSDDTLDLKETAFQLMVTCEDIFSSCEFKSEKISCCDYFQPVFTEKGFCYTFNSLHHERRTPLNSNVSGDFSVHYIKETDLKWSLMFSVKNTTIKMPIYILNFDEQAGIDVEPQHIWDYHVDKISLSVKQTYTTEDTRQLSVKQRHCVFADEIRLKIDENYTYTACTRQCRMDNSMKLCNCVPYFYPQVDNYKYCTLQQLKCVSERLEAIKAVEACSCELGCSNTVYEVEKLSEVTEDETDQLETLFVSWPMVRYKREVFFGWVDLLVSFGGIAGLFLGFSLLSGVEILYYFTIRACCMVVQDKKELERVQYQKKLKSMKMFDLKLQPFFTKVVPSGKLNKNLSKNTIHPLNNLKWRTSQSILSPNGIEFLN